MELPASLAAGLVAAFTLPHLLCGAIGCVLGTLVGVLPGIGQAAAIAMLLPATQALSPFSTLILLAGVYCGAQYGGSTPAILANLPGEPSAAPAAADGHQLALQGRAGAALAVAALGSFFAGCVGVALLAGLAAPLAALALHLGPAEQFSLAVLGLAGVLALASGSLLKAMATLVLGMLLSLVGAHGDFGPGRFDFDRPELAGGIGFVALALGLYGNGELIARLSLPAPAPADFAGRLGRPWPSRQDLRDMAPAVLRGTAWGSVLGLVPGGGALLAAFTAHAFERRAPARPGEMPFGRGNVRALAAPESANNAGAQSAFLPLLALGIPPNAVMALIGGALALRGLAPGPAAIAGDSGLVAALALSMWLGNALLLVLNLPLAGVAGLWRRLLRLPERLLLPALVAVCALGALLLRGEVFDLWLVTGFGALGFAFTLLRIDPAPLLLGFVMAPGMERNLRAALPIAGGSWRVFVTSPVSALLLAAAGVLLGLMLVPRR